MQPKKTTIGVRLKAARQKEGLSQSEAAQKWGISKRTLQEWEQGRFEPRGLYRAHIETVLSKIER
jgi:putative transcriptional regulator